ncbi:RNA-binding protein [Mesorhizobium sp. M3A.F.Ca.ET.174.01.1.1]|nr:RNA-binding protein [Mesorhizobium sp. M3A.F.Ca.ET.201.01.1.1]TGS82413.1 RNA-binding protein [Mesorhizobium sp. M3A.F.Ca.ET.175.01.1.1]TGT22235.1 RNA-binding protein [Mesorhizobium sp. M3A.F.Ca.ET.174.01.1.1]
MPTSRSSGVYEPADLALLQRVFDRLCQERRLAKKDREQREQLAAEVIHVFSEGITGEMDLWRAISRRTRFKRRLRSP